MTPYTHRYTVDLRSGMRVERMRHPSARGDARAHRFVVTLMDGHTPISLNGAAAYARVIRPDGQTIMVEGEIVSGSVSVTLTEECYAAGGSMVVTITAETDAVRQSILRVEMEAS